MSTGCEFYGDALVELARGELEPGRVERVEAHLETCDACRTELAVVRAVGAARAPVPEGLEARIRAAVADRTEEGAGPVRPTAGWPVASSRSRSSWRGWRVWALPAAAAAALALWIGGALVLPSGDPGAAEPAEPVASTELAAEYDPYGAWPAADGVVAGDVVLSELTVEELEALLEEMQ